MSKAKDTVEELRSKLFDRKKEETVQEAEKTLEASLDNIVYDVIQNPDVKNRSFLAVKIKYDLKTNQAVIVETREFQDKAAGLTIQMNKENLKYLFERNRSSK